jgi:hypothetical protein
MRSHPTPKRPLLLALALGSLLLAGSPVAGRGGNGDDDGGAAGSRSLKLRINDAVGRPGAQVGLVVRTYAARPLRQGRVTVRVRKPARAKGQLGLTAEDIAQPARPLTYVRSVVYSRNGDAVSRGTPVNGPDSQSVDLRFSSASGSVNAADGPMAVIYMRIDRAVAPGSEFLLELDPAATGLTDANGKPLSITPINGRLRVRASKASTTP